MEQLQNLLILKEIYKKDLKMPCGHFVIKAAGFVVLQFFLVYVLAISFSF